MVQFTFVEAVWRHRNTANQPLGKTNRRLALLRALASNVLVLVVSLVLGVTVPLQRYDL